MADISHELRTPVTILTGEIETMKDGIRPLDMHQVLSLDQEVTRLRRLIEDLYELSVSDIGGLRYSLGGMDQSIVTEGWEGNVLVIESTRVNGERTVQHLRLLERPLRLERISNLPGRSGKSQLIQIKQIFVPEGIINDKEEKGGDMESSYFKRLED